MVDGKECRISEPLQARNLDGYTLFDSLNDGAPVTVKAKGETYTLQFQGDRFGGGNCLQVQASDGTQRTYGWGWECRLAFQALEEIEQGWDQAEKYRYKPLGSMSGQEHTYF